MNQFRELVSSYLGIIPKEYLPMISVGLFIIGIVILFIFFIVCVAFINSQPKPKTLIKREDLLKKREVPAEKIMQEELPILSGPLGEILTLWGILKAGPVTKSFFRALKAMKDSTYDIRWRYKFPCFMMLGEQGSGKSTLLNNLNFEHLASEESENNSMWKLFKQGAIFEFPQVGSHEESSKFWAFISELFLFIRPRRPLDGIIVTVSAEQLLDESAHIENLAKEMFSRIFKFQHEINFRLPIYLIVTKTDTIPGFQEFVHLQHEYSKQQMFGWSCPYSLNINFSSDWISEIFSTIDSGIRKAIFYFSRKRNIDENLAKAVLFSSHFDKIKPILSKYILTMFHSHNPQDGLILRGVYFVGKQKKNAIDPSGFIQMSALTPGVNVDATFNHLHNDDLYFVHDLFKDKIFKEFNIAHPIVIDIAGMTKNEYRNKAIAVGAAFVLSAGWFWENNRIKNNIHNYYASTADMKTALLKIRHLELTMSTKNDQYEINRQASALLHKMPTVKRHEFFSPFVPQSWFSSIRSDVKTAIELIFDSVIVKAMYMDLNLNTKDVLIAATDSHKRIEEKKDIFDVENFETFRNLRKFTDHIKEIQDISKEYNSMRTDVNSDNVTNVTESIFKDKFAVTDEIRHHVPNPRIMPPKFDLNNFQENIEQTLQQNFMSFVNDTLDVTVTKVFASVDSDIEKLISAGKNARVRYDVQDLAKLYTKIELIEDILQNQHFAWIHSHDFCPSESYAMLVKELRNLNVVPPETLDKLTKEAQDKFEEYKTALAAYKSILTENFVAENFSAPSENFLAFKKELKSILDLPFIQKSKVNKFVAELPSDKMLLWDIKRLKELSALIDKYNEFNETMPEDMRSQFFELYKAIVRKCFYPTLQFMLGNSQILEDLPMGTSRTLLESSYKKQAQNIQNASAVLPKIVVLMGEIVDDNNLEDFGFADLIIKQYLMLLEKIDALFNLEKPYSANPALFDSWNGDCSPNYMNLGNQTNVKQYLEAQFERIRFLSKDLAAPIVDLLTIPAIYEKIRDKRLLKKWKEIINNVDDYENKKPGNSIAALEAFVTESLSKVSLDNLDPQGEMQDISSNDGDYFLSNRSNVAKSLMSRAEVVKYDKAVKAYNVIHDLFNKNLAHKFPFGDTEDNASLKDIEDFINSYENSDKNIYNILLKNKDKKNINPMALEFLKSLENIVPFFKHWVEQSKGSDPNTAPICFSVLLRPFPNMESMTSAVLDRIFAINGVPVADNSNGVCFNNDKIMVMFGWVASADEQPDPKSASGALRVEKNNAAFSYEGSWAIFRLIEKHKITKGVEYPNGIVLQFEVPITLANQNYEVVNSKMVFKITPMLREGDKSTPMVWPVFPTESPELHKTESSNKPIDAVNIATVSEPQTSAPEVTITNPSDNAVPPLNVGVSFD